MTTAVTSLYRTLVRQPLLAAPGASVATLGSAAPAVLAHAWRPLRHL